MKRRSTPFLVDWLLLASSIVLTPATAIAAPIIDISADQAQGAGGKLVTLRVASGYGLNLNFAAMGEMVKRAWIDYPGDIGMSFDSNLCQSGQQNCSGNEGATIIHLRRIRGINFPNLPKGHDGGTLLTLVTDSRKVYQFRVVPASTSGITGVNIVPAIDRSPVIPDPIIPIPSNTPTIQSRRPVLPPVALAPSEPTYQPVNPSAAIAERSPAAAPEPTPVPPSPKQSESNGDSGYQPVTPAVRSPLPKPQAAPVPTEETTEPPHPTDDDIPHITYPPPEEALTVDGGQSPADNSRNLLAVLPHRLEKPAEVPTPSNRAPSPVAATAPRQESAAIAANSSNRKPQTATPPTRRTPPIAPPPDTSAIAPVPATETAVQANPHDDANAVVAGLVIARQKRQISYQSRVYLQAQNAIAWLRRGLSRQQAATRAGVPFKVLQQLIAWGQSRP